MEIKSLAKRRGAWITTASELYEIQTKRKALEEKEQALKDKLKVLSDNRDATGGGYLFSVSFSKGRVNYQLIPQLKGLDLDPFRGSKIASWKLLKLGARA